VSYFVTKYALTDGIWEVEDKYASVSVEGYLFVGEQNRRHALIGKRYWHKTLEEAKAHAEDLLKARIKSLKAQAKKLEGQFGGAFNLRKWEPR
jgi:F0F1-type ATP synthase epsilon subunit